VAAASSGVFKTIAGMAQNFIACNREQSFLLPPDVREWLPEGHLAWFVIDAVGVMDTSAFYAAYRDDGHGRAGLGTVDDDRAVVVWLGARCALVACDRARLRRGRRVPGDRRAETVAQKEFGRARAAAGSGSKRTASDHATLRAVSIDPRDKWSMFHFSQSNPDGAGQGDVAALLRRVADSIDALGDVVVEDMTFSSQTTADERAPLVTVYYHRDDRA
jgi:hypothetical protein